MPIPVSRIVATALSFCCEMRISITDCSGENLTALESRLSIDNLLSNAVKFSPEQSVIEIRISQQNDRAVATILDTGIGIASHDLDRVFDWFQRGGNVPEHVSGTGIGLAGARQIVEQLGGA